MAEIATVARPYAQALYEACADDVGSAQGWLNGLAQVVADSDLLQLASNPKVGASQVFEVIQGALGAALPTRGANFLRTVIANGRLAALPEMARQFRALADRASEITEAVVYTPFPLSQSQLADLQQTLERHFARKLKLEQKPDPALIGGVRVVAGDEVLDASVKARLEQMKTVLTSA